MTELFIQVLNMSISALWLILAVLVLRLLLKKAPKWVRVLLWGFVAVRLLCPFSVESAMSLIPSAQTIEPGILMDTSPAIETGIPVVNQTVNPVISESSTPSPGASVNPLQIIFGISANLWLLGMGAMLLYGMVSYLLLRKTVRAAVHVEGNIYQSEYISSPFVMGVFRPRIYLPYTLSGQSLPHVIAHEQAHIRRKDHWWKPLGFVLLTLHWFNPMVWVAYILLCRDIELACDEKVIKELGCDERADYSAALLSCSIRHRRIAACPVAFGEVSVKSRIRSVLSYKKPTFWILLAAMTVCVFVMVCFLTNPPQDSYSLRIVIPAGSQAQFVYADEEISPLGKQITVSSGDGLGDTEVHLKTVQVKTETAYEPFYLTPGMPVKMEVEKDGWFKIGVNVQNPTDQQIVVYLEVENVEVRIASAAAAVIKWFDYTEDHSQMSYDKELEIQLEEFPEVSFRYTPYEITAVGMDPNDRATLISGLPIWNAYFTDLTGDGFPEICSELSMGSGIIDNRVMIHDYANGVTYKLADRGVYDYFLRMDLADGCLYVDKKPYNSSELAASGRLTFRDGSVQLEGFSVGPVTILRAELLEIQNGYFLVKPTEGSWESSGADRIMVPMNNMYPSPEPTVGDILEIEYDGLLLETYPAEIRNPYSIQVIETAVNEQFFNIESVSYEYLISGENQIINGEADIDILQSILSTDQWLSGVLPSCDCDFTITINEESYLYHSDCGTIIDVSQDRCLSLTDEQKERLNRIFGLVQNVGTNRYYLTIGAEGVQRIEVSMPDSSGGCENANGTLFKKGERLYLDNLYGYYDLRGLTIQAIGKNGETIWSASVPNTDENYGLTQIRSGNWILEKMD